jgi:hypothetical protein
MKRYAKLATVLVTSAAISLLAMPAMAKSFQKEIKTGVVVKTVLLPNVVVQPEVLLVRAGNGGGPNAASGPCLGTGRGVGKSTLGGAAKRSANRRGGYGPGDGTGNAGDGPQDGTGYGPGDCTTPQTGTGTGSDAGNGNQFGSGDGTGNDGDGPADGTGYAPAAATGV